MSMRRSPPESTLVLGAALAALIPCPAAAAENTGSYGDLPPPPRAAAAPAAMTLPLELIVNERRSGVVAAVKIDAGRFHIALADLRRAGLEVGAPGEALWLDELPGIEARYDVPLQQLRLTAAADYFPAQRIGGKARKFTPASYDVGALLNYDVYASGGGGRETEASLFHETRVFSGAGSFSTTGVLRSGAGPSYVRYDTSWRRSDETTAVTMEAGDLITRSLPWASAVRLGGIQVSRDFAVRPDIITYPLPEFAGSAALPSTVDLIVGGQRVAGGPVAPGPFQVETLTPISGAGTANLVVTDMHGRSVSTAMPFYVSSDLLPPGLTDFAAAIGAFRQNYGIRNFDYGGVAATASLRRGVSQDITLEVHAEIADDMSVAGGGAIVRLGGGGVLSGSYSRSFRADADGGDGSQLTLGYEYQSRSISLALRHSSQSAGYADLGLLDLVRAPRARRISSATISLSLGPAGTLGFGYFAIDEAGGADTRLANASLSLPLWRGTRIGASATKDFEDKSWSGAFSLTLPLGRNRGNIAAGTADDGEGRQVWRVDYARAIPSDGGLGWSASAAGGDGATLLRGDVAWRSDPVLLRGGAYASGKDATFWGGASGSLIVMDGSLFAANRVADAFVVVTTGSTAGIPVRYENQLIGRTNAAGKLLIPYASAFYPGLYEIDPLDLPANVAVPETARRVAVARGSGHVVRFPVRTLRPVRLIARDAAGALVPAGTRAAVLAGGQESGFAIVGWDGVVFAEDAGDALSIAMTLPGGPCRIDLGAASRPDADAASGDTILDLGERTCVPDRS